MTQIFFDFYLLPKDDFPSSVASLSQSHRLWTRAIGNVSRLSPTLPEDTPPLKVAVSNPFEVAKVAPEDAISADDHATKNSSSTASKKGRRFDGMMWRTSRVSVSSLSLSPRHQALSFSD